MKARFFTCLAVLLAFSSNANAQFLPPGLDVNNYPPIQWWNSIEETVEGVIDEVILGDPQAEAEAREAVRPSLWEVQSAVESETKYTADALGMASEQVKVNKSRKSKLTKLAASTTSDPVNVKKKVTAMKKWASTVESYFREVLTFAATNHLSELARCTALCEEAETLLDSGETSQAIEKIAEANECRTIANELGAAVRITYDGFTGLQEKLEESFGSLETLLMGLGLMRP